MHHILYTFIFYIYIYIHICVYLHIELLLGGFNWRDDPLSLFFLVQHGWCFHPHLVTKKSGFTPTKTTIAIEMIIYSGVFFRCFLNIAIGRKT